jgi:hypothetical protein
VKLEGEPKGAVKLAEAAARTGGRHSRGMDPCEKECSGGNGHAACDVADVDDN